MTEHIPGARSGPAPGGDPVILQDRPFRRVPTTAREVLKSIRAHERLLGAMESITEDDSLAFMLAARVEKVLALHEPPSDSTDWDQGWLACLEMVLRILNGEEP